MFFQHSNFDPVLRDKDICQLEINMPFVLLMKPLENVPWVCYNIGLPSIKHAYVQILPLSPKTCQSHCWVTERPQLCFPRTGRLQIENEKGTSQVRPVPCLKLADQISHSLSAKAQEARVVNLTDDPVQNNKPNKPRKEKRVECMESTKMLPKTVLQGK